MPDAPSKYDGIITPDDWLCANCKKPRKSHAQVSAFVRERHDFVGMLRIKNEARWIREVIDSILPLCGRVFVLDDHSTDDTVQICGTYPEVTVFSSPFSGFNEARDKNWLYDRIMEACAPAWILCIDGDEVLAPGGAQTIRNMIAANPRCQSYRLKIIFVWNDRNTMRTDWVYGEFWRPSLFAPFHPEPGVPDHIKLIRELRFMATPFGRARNGDEPNLHCSSVPQRFLHGAQRCPAALLHYGYMIREDRVRKLDFYTGKDWLNRSEDCYRHMCQGDGVTLAELPITQQLLAEGKLSAGDVRFMTDLPAGIQHGQIWNGSALLHSGPLTLEAIQWQAS